MSWDPDHNSVIHLPSSHVYGCILSIYLWENLSCWGKRKREPCLSFFVYFSSLSPNCPSNPLLCVRLTSHHSGSLLWCLQADSMNQEVPLAPSSDLWPCTALSLTLAKVRRGGVIVVGSSGMMSCSIKPPECSTVTSLYVIYQTLKTWWLKRSLLQYNKQFLFCFELGLLCCFSLLE